MSLSYQDKMDLSYALMKIYRLKLLDKESSIIPSEGRLTHFDDPSNNSLLGSIGGQPNPDFGGPQQPNSMGMVLLVNSHDSKIELSVSGQFDLVHRYIPDFAKMQANLIHDDSGIRSRQQILLAHKRYTVVFHDIHLIFDTNENCNEWLDINEDQNIKKYVDDLEERLLQDSRVYKSCELSNSGASLLFLPWDVGICNQETLNSTVREHIFNNCNEVLPYTPKIRARIRSAPHSIRNENQAYLVEIYLENDTSREVSRTFGVNNPYLLDAQFTAKLLTGTHQSLPHRLAPKDFRYKQGNNVPGYGITTSIEQIDDLTFITNAMPIFSQPKIENPSPAELGMLYALDFDILAQKPVETTQSLVDAIIRYEEQWQNHIEQFEDRGNIEEADESRRSLVDLIREKEQIIDGVNLLKNNSDLRKCFTLMNEAMLSAVKIQRKPFKGWRLFQLGFILTQIRAVYERTAPEKELTDHLQTAEVLWFPTGGGKTEAYMGLITMAMFHERKMGRKYGVTAWLRFPLRMLSVQQFQRLSYVVAQANILKQREKIFGHPFTIGYFTGGGTPRTISDDYETENSTFLPRLSKERLNDLKFISDCPYCEKKNTVNIVTDFSHSRIKHVCSNLDCWSNTQSSSGEYGEGIKGELGIYVSDEECYRYTPSIMVGTIDKLSNIAHNRRFRYFFGGATHFCPDHGFSFEGRCVHKRIIQNDDGKYTSEQCPNNSRTSAVKTVSIGNALFPGVSFFVQDELHLLRENTGNFDAHYETLFNTIQIANGGRKPKNLAATATIKEYKHHVKHLYLAKPRRFPVPGFNLNESFYSRVIHENNKMQIRRLYMGILPIGSGKITDKATALASSRYLCMIDELRSQLRNDPKGTCEQLEFANEKASDLLEYIETYLNINLMYVNSFQSLSEVQHALEDVQSRYPDREILQLSSKSTLEEIQKAIEHIENKAPDDQTRQMIATSVVSHGVDIHRLNFMIISGWPKSISEYMQSSARAGRIEPGIVLNIFNSKTLFQYNVFMNFTDYHKFMDRLVESVPVNRFSPNLIEKTLPGIICAWILNWAAGQEAPWGPGITKNAGQVKLALKDTSHNARTELKNLMVSSLAIPNYLSHAFDSRVIADFERTLDRKLEIALNQLEGMPTDVAEELLSDALERLIKNRPMRSLRDIESQIRVLPQLSQSGDLLEALSRRN